VPPNNPRDNSTFWADSDLLTAIEEQAMTKPDVILGDFNVVEDPQDPSRLPPRADSDAAVEALHSFKFTTECDVSDEWRQAHKDRNAYTFGMSSTGSESRLDRIYVTPALPRSN
jgi:exonuclease III